MAVDQIKTTELDSFNLPLKTDEVVMINNAVPQTVRVLLSNLLNLQFGQIYIAGGTGTQNTNATPDTFDLITQFNSDGANGLSTAGATPDKANDKIILVDTGHWLVLWNISFNGASGSPDYTCSPFLAGTEVSVARAGRETSSTDTGNFGSFGIIDNDSASQDLDLRIAANDASKAFEVVEASLLAVRIGRT